MSLPWVFTILIRTGSMQVLSMLVIDACRFIQQPTWQDSAVPFRDDFGCRSRSAAGSRRRAEYRRDRSATSAAGNPATGQHPVYVTGPAIIFILLILFTILLWYSSAILVRSLFTRYGYVTRYVTMALAYPHIVVTPITTFTSTFAHFVFN